jgi:hypothetical protein
MARFGEKLKVEWSNSQLIPTLLLSIYSGRWASWRGGKESPHRSNHSKADGGNPKGVNLIVTQLNVWCKPDAKEKKTPTDHCSPQGQ